MDKWKTKIPVAHRMKVGEVLGSLYLVDDDGAPVCPGLEMVSFRATWSANDAGQMLSFSPLVHRLRTPEWAHLRRYKRDQVRSTVVAGSRSGETIYHGVQRTLIEIYDELIDGIDGYSWNENAITSADDARRWMDANHKVCAAGQLFRTVSVSEDE
jgi:hypothetical protein